MIGSVRNLIGKISRRQWLLAAAAIGTPMICMALVHALLVVQLEEQDKQNDILIAKIEAIDTRLKESIAIKDSVERTLLQIDDSRRLKSAAYAPALLLSKLSRFPRMVSLRRIDISDNVVTIEGDAADLLSIGQAARELRRADEIGEVSIVSASLGHDGSYGFSIQAEFQSEYVGDIL